MCMGEGEENIYHKVHKVHHPWTLKNNLEVGPEQKEKISQNKEKISQNVMETKEQIIEHNKMARDGYK